MPVGTWVIRTAESVVFTLWPPGPLQRKTSMRRSLLVDLDVDLPRPRASPARPAALVCTRPCDSVTGTRWTRWTPPSNFSSAVRRVAGLDHALAFTATVTDL